MWVSITHFPDLQALISFSSRVDGCPAKGVRFTLVSVSRPQSNAVSWAARAVAHVAKPSRLAKRSHQSDDIHAF